MYLKCQKLVSDVEVFPNTLCRERRELVHYFQYKIAINDVLLEVLSVLGGYILIRIENIHVCTVVKE